MKHLKHLFILTLALFLSLPLFAACGGGSQISQPYSFRHGSATMTPGTLAKDALTSLGSPQSFSESGSCGGIPGTDKVYRYTGFTVYTTPGTEGDVITEIVLNDDSVQTPEGLSIGSTEQTVKDALGIGQQSGETWVYTSGTTQLIFTMRDGKVAGIRYGSKN